MSTSTCAEVTDDQGMRMTTVFVLRDINNGWNIYINGVYIFSTSCDDINYALQQGIKYYRLEFAPNDALIQNDSSVADDS